MPTFIHNGIRINTADAKRLGINTRAQDAPESVSPSSGPASEADAKPKTRAPRKPAAK